MDIGDEGIRYTRCVEFSAVFRFSLIPKIFPFYNNIVWKFSMWVVARLFQQNVSLFTSLLPAIATATNNHTTITPRLFSSCSSPSLFKHKKKKEMLRRRRRRRRRWRRKEEKNEKISSKKTHRKYKERTIKGYYIWKGNV